MSVVEPILAAVDISKSFGPVTALDSVSIEVRPGEVVCLLGDNGAGKSTLIKVLSGFHNPDTGTIVFDGQPIELSSPRAALSLGISTVYQDLAVFPLMSVARNYVAGLEPTRGRGLLSRFDEKEAARLAFDGLRRIGIDLTDMSRMVGTMSGGERQVLAIARAEHRGARVLILDEPTSALGVREAALVLRHVHHAAGRGTAVILITHNVRHALPVGDRFVVLNQGRVAADLPRDEVSESILSNLMAGGHELVSIRDDPEDG